MLQTSFHRALAAAVILAGALSATSAMAKDTKTEEPVFEFSSPFVAPPAGAQTHYIWKINRIDGSLYLCQTTTASVKCNQVAGPSGESRRAATEPSANSTENQSFTALPPRRHTAAAKMPSTTGPMP